MSVYMVFHPIRSLEPKCPCFSFFLSFFLACLFAYLLASLFSVLCPFSNCSFFLFLSFFPSFQPPFFFRFFFPLFLIFLPYPSNVSSLSLLHFRFLSFQPSFFPLFDPSCHVMSASIPGHLGPYAPQGSRKLRK